MLPTGLSFGNSDTPFVHILAGIIILLGFLSGLIVITAGYIRDPQTFNPPTIIVSMVFSLIVAAVQAFGGQQGKQTAMEGYRLANQAQQQTVQTVKDVAAIPTIGGGTTNAQTN